MPTKNDFDFDFGICGSASPDPDLHPLLKLLTIILLPIILAVLLVIGIVAILVAIMRHGGAYVAAGVCLKRGWHRFLVESEEDFGGGGYRREKRCIACGRRRTESQSSTRSHDHGEIP